MNKGFSSAAGENGTSRPVAPSDRAEKTALAAILRQRVYAGTAGMEKVSLTTHRRTACKTGSLAEWSSERPIGPSGLVCIFLPFQCPFHRQNSSRRHASLASWTCCATATWETRRWERGSAPTSNGQEHPRRTGGHCRGCHDVFVPDLGGNVLLIGARGEARGGAMCPRNVCGSPPRGSREGRPRSLAIGLFQCRRDYMLCDCVALRRFPRAFKNAGSPAC